MPEGHSSRSWEARQFGHAFALGPSERAESHDDAATFPAIAGNDSVDMRVRLAELSEARGRLAAVVAQSPSRMQALHDGALVESIVFGCRQDGLTVGPERVQAVLATLGPLQDRADREIGGYHRALTLIHSKQSDLSISDETIRQLHQLLFPDRADAAPTTNATVKSSHGRPISRARFIKKKFQPRRRPPASPNWCVLARRPFAADGASDRCPGRI